MPEPVAVLAYGFNFGVRFGFDAEPHERWPQWFRDAHDNPDRDLADFAYDALLTAYNMCLEPIPDGTKERDDAIDAVGIHIVSHGGLIPSLTGHIIAVAAYVTDWNEICLVTLEAPDRALSRIRDACQILGIPMPDGEPSWILAATEHL